MPFDGSQPLPDGPTDVVPKMSTDSNSDAGSDSPRNDTEAQSQTKTGDADPDDIIATANEEGDFTDEFKPDTDSDEISEREQARDEAIEEIRATIEDLVAEFGGSIPEDRATFLLTDELDCDLAEARDLVLDHATIEDGDVTGSSSGYAHVVNRNESDDDDVPLPWSQIEWLYSATPGDFPEGQMQKQSDINAEAREEIAQKLDEEYHWMFLVDDPQGIEEFRVYEPDSGMYEKGAKRKLGRIMRRKIGGKANTNEVNEVADWLKSFNETTLDEIEAGDESLRCFTNGVLNYETWDFTPEHRPEHLFVRSVNSRWDESVDTSIVRNFLEDITSREEDAHVVAEMMGDALVDHYDRQWFGVIYGPGSNGKSVLLSALRQVLGVENVTGESLHDIAETRWSSQRLVGGAGAFANIDPDIAARKITDASAIKNNTGGDSTAHEQKGQNKFDAVNDAKMLFGANGPCVFQETKRSIKRRLKPIELEYEYLPEDEVDGGNPMQKVRDTELEDELTTDDARAAWVQVMAKGLQRLQNNGEFSFPESQDELFERYQKASDPIQVFLGEMVRNEPVNWTDTDTPVYMTYQELYDMYTNMCNDMNETPATSKTFGSELKKQSVVEMEPYYPAEIDSQHAKRYVVPAQLGWQYTGTSVKERFAMRAPEEIDAPSPGDVVNGDSDDDRSDSEHEGGDTLLAEVTSAITQLANANGSGVGHGMILARVDDDIDDVSELDSVLMKGVREDKFEMNADGKFTVAIDDDETYDDSDDDGGSDDDDGGSESAGDDNEADDGDDTDSVSESSPHDSQSAETEPDSIDLDELDLSSGEHDVMVELQDSGGSSTTADMGDFVGDAAEMKGIVGSLVEQGLVEVTAGQELHVVAGGDF